jgi:hypothetical protein
MPNTVLLKRSSVAGKVPTTLEYGEVTINYTDGVLWYKTSANTITRINSAVNGSTVNGVAYLGTANVLVNSAGLTFNPTGNTLTVSGAVTASNVTATGNLIVSARLRDYNGNAGLNGQLLVSTGSGVQWQTVETGSLESLSDVNLSDPQVQQVLTYDGTNWVNADSNAVVASAVFASSQSDLGYVTDLVLTITEDEGSVADVTNNIYDLGVLSFTGIISLNNIDQSIKSDYLGYSIIFGF